MEFENMINTIQLGDCYEIIKQIPDKSVDLVIIDPPYSFCTGGKHTGLFRTRETRYHDQIEEHNLDKNIDLSILNELDRIMKKVNIYIWCNKEQIHQYLNHYENDNIKFEIIIWNKINPIPTVNNKYLSDKEYCLFFKEKGVLLGGSVETKKTVYQTSLNVRDKEMFLHPTIKPLPIIKNLIINSSNENDIVFDCFCGSGTTCLGAKELNRRYIGIEIDKKFYKIATDRLDGVLANGQMSIMFNEDGEVLNNGTKSNDN